MQVLIEKEVVEEGAHRLPAGHYAKLIVKDNGEGIRDEIREKIFEPFFTTKKRGVGTGMGLSMVHGIVESHGGKIEVESTPGEGTRFGVYLPLSDALEGGEDATVSGFKSLPRGSETILVVDDEKEITRILDFRLGQLGYGVETYNDSLRALASFMKDPGRYELVQSMIEIKPNLPVIFQTGYSSDSDLVKNSVGRSTAASKVLTKPVAVRDYAIEIRRILDASRAKN